MNCRRAGSLRSATMKAASASSTGLRPNVRPRADKSCRTMGAYAARDSFRRDQRGELLLGELHAEPVLEHEDQFHVLERVPLGNVAPHEVGVSAGRQLEHQQDEVRNLALHLRVRGGAQRSTCTSTLRLSALAATASSGTLTLPSKGATPAKLCSHSRAGRFLGPVVTSKVTWRIGRPSASNRIPCASIPSSNRRPSARQLTQSSSIAS